MTRRTSLRRSLAVLAFGLATSLPGFGQAATRVSFRVLCFEHVQEITSVFVAVPGGADGKLEVPLYTSEFSGEFETAFAGGRASLFVEETGADGNITRRVVAEGPLGRSPRQAFVLVPAPEGEDAVYRIVSFDDREESFPMGATRVINFASFPVRLNLAGADMPPIEPGGAQVYPPVRAVDDWNMFSVRVDFGVEADRWVPVATQSWKASDRKRDWVITRVDPATRQPAIRLYQDIPPWRQEALPTGEQTP